MVNEYARHTAELAALIAALGGPFEVQKDANAREFMAYVRAMCAIGKRGQLGLAGVMPWEGAKGPEFIADVQRLPEVRAVTRG